ncbi:MAG TPA: SGNH/GDSL hydrolase family protein [Gemmatimonadales bacterium]|nr:SGNH/GDSL hydrolase family protein [Gemmatimonadales bacterium]
MQRIRVAAALLLALPLLAGCYENDPLNAPNLSSSNGLMERYVSMGNSITAGYQSGGINDSTQRRSYAVLFASRAGAPFFIPSLQGRGCAPPLTNNVTGARVGGGTANTCDLRADERLFYVSNVAVPGATSLSPITNMGAGANSNALTTFILGGRTQIQAMQDADPTFLTVWIGNNDVLGSLTFGADPGNPALITPQDTFVARYDEILDSIEATGNPPTVLFSVADVTVIPYTSRGATYWCLKTGLCPGVPAAPFPPNFTVDVSCAPNAAVPTSNGQSILVPWPVGIPKIAAAAQGAPAGIPQTTLNCLTDPVVSPTELTALQAAVAGYNGYISNAATARGMAYVDVNAALGPLVASGAIPPFPDITGALTGGSVTFGPYFSLDGVHPSTLAHQLIADSLVSKVNSYFGTNIP